MKFYLQQGETLHFKSAGMHVLNFSIQDAVINAFSVSKRNEGGYIYITSDRIVFTTTQGLLGLLVGNITDSLFPALQDIKFEIPITEITSLRIVKVIISDGIYISCKNNTEYVLTAGLGKAKEMIRLIQEACNNKGVFIPVNQ